MSKKILFVEDDEKLQTQFAKFFGRRDFTISSAYNGKEAKEKLEISSEPFDIIILDLRMPEMTGEEFLAGLQGDPETIPPIIVLSAFFNRDAVAICLSAGVKCLFKKPFKLRYLEKVVSAILQEDEAALIEFAYDQESKIRMVTFPNTVLFKLDEELQVIVEARDPVGVMVVKREEALYRFFKDQLDNPKPNKIKASEPIFVVARRWNSWYPSFFNVPGGCYALTEPPLRNVHPKVAIIDPGFRCLDVLSRLGVSVKDIASCIITHNHPDHVAGIFELMAARHALDMRTNGWCNKTTVDMFGDCSGFGLEMNELQKNIRSTLFSYNSPDGEMRKVTVLGFPTAHREMGRHSASLGLKVSCWRDKPAGDELIGRAVVLGDTEYSRADHGDLFLNLLTTPDVKFVVLHVGSMQMKQREGGHLYFPGLKRILTDVEAVLDRKKWTNKKLPVLLSEWGLEHATGTQIASICGKELHAFDDRNPMLETAELLNKEFNYVHILPADIGLRVGMETGLIYLPDGSTQEAHEVIAVATQDGLEYRSK